MIFGIEQPASDGCFDEATGHLDSHPAHTLAAALAVSAHARRAGAEAWFGSALGGSAHAGTRSPDSDATRGASGISRYLLLSAQQGASRKFKALYISRLTF